MYDRLGEKDQRIAVIYLAEQTKIVFFDEARKTRGRCPSSSSPQLGGGGGGGERVAVRFPGCGFDMPLQLLTLTRGVEKAATVMVHIIYIYKYLQYTEVYYTVYIDVCTVHVFFSLLIETTACASLHRHGGGQHEI